MEDILLHSKSNKPLSEREEYLFQLMERLDKETYDLYSEITDIGNNSFYKTKTISDKMNKLIDVFSKVKESYEYLEQIETLSYAYAYMRKRFREFLSASASLLVASADLLANGDYTSLVPRILLGLGSYVVLSSISDGEYIREVEGINSVISQFDLDQLKRIAITLENSTRLYKNKVQSSRRYLGDEFTDEEAEIISANAIIMRFLNGKMSEEDIERLDPELKRRIMQILQEDLNTEDNSIFDLLDQTREQDEKSKQLIKEYSE